MFNEFLSQKRQPICQKIRNVDYEGKKGISLLEIRWKLWFFVTFNIIINHIFPENFIEIPQVVQKVWRFSPSILTIFINFRIFWHFLFDFFQLIFRLFLIFKWNSRVTRSKDFKIVNKKTNWSHISIRSLAALGFFDLARLFVKGEILDRLPFLTWKWRQVSS